MHASLVLFNTFAFVSRVAPGDFSSRQTTHFFCSYGLRNRVRLCVDLVTHHQK